MLQKILEKPLEKKAGRNYGPPGNKTLVYFLDDMNMPEVKSIKTKITVFIVRSLLMLKCYHTSGRLLRNCTTTHFNSTAFGLWALVR